LGTGSSARAAALNSSDGASFAQSESSSMFSFAEHLRTHAPFLVSWAPALFSAVLGALLWSMFSTFFSRQTIVTRPRGSPKDEDNYVFLDNDPAAEEHPMSMGETAPIPFVQAKYTESEMLQKSAEFYTAMNGRRTVRHFSSKPVSPEVIKNIIHTAGWSLVFIFSAYSVGTNYVFSRPMPLYK
jgi:hypothetical protein